MTDDLFGTVEHKAGAKGMRMLPGVVGAADFAGYSNEHRITLERDWSGTLGAPFALWVGMNPSCADALVDDMTIRKEQHFTKLIGFSRMVKVNVASYRCTDPLKLPTGIELSHPRNHASIKYLSGVARVVIMATGHPPAPLAHLATHVLQQMRSDGRMMMCLGKTNDGWPRHPSRLGYGTKFEEFK